ncbi:MAG TPA: DUF3859 domain-containing protein [Noviherbaspirillum sp.]|nr:DUF3859 domain-containing protein [Noviherbaspirillum sp.]
MRAVRTICVAMFAAAFFSACSTLAPAQLRAQLTDYGIFTTGKDEIRLDPKTPTGLSRRPSEVRISKQTTQIPLSMGTRFGVCYVVDGLEPNTPFDLRKTVVHPKLTRPDGSVSTSFSALRRGRAHSSRIEGCEGYGFDHPFEMVAGVWRISISIEGQELVSQDFEVR